MTGFNKETGVTETPLVNIIEKAIFDAPTFQTLISQSGNDAINCARDIARVVAAALASPDGQTSL